MDPGVPRAESVDSMHSSVHGWHKIREQLRLLEELTTCSTTSAGAGGKCKGPVLGSPVPSRGFPGAGVRDDGASIES